jgi:hypothetical protein
VDGERLDRLESRLAALEGAVRDLVARLAALEGGAAPAPAPAPEAPTAAPEAVPALEGAPVVNILSLAGRSFLVLGGAFLLRSLTDSGTLPRNLGVPLGLVYAVGTMLFADRAAGQGKRLSAVFHGLTGVAIGYPIVWEATTRLKFLPPPVAAVALGILTAVLLAVAWHRDLVMLAWAPVLTVVLTSLGLLAATAALSTFTLLLFATGLATLWLRAVKDWPGIQWPAALAADLAVFQGILLATRQGGAPEPWNAISPGTVLALALALPLFYLGSVIARTLARHEGVGAFAIVQTVLALAIGFGGGSRIVAATGWSSTGLGVGALIAAAFLYAFAFVVPGVGRAGLFHGSLGLVLAAWGVLLACDAQSGALVWTILGLGLLIARRRGAPFALEIHGTVYLALAAITSGALAAALDALLGSAGGPWSKVTGAGLLALAATAGSYALVASSPERTLSKWPLRLPALVLAFVAVLGAGGLLVRLVSGPAASAPLVAVVRTAVLCGAAAALATARRFPPVSDLAVFAYPVLVAEGLKLVAEDLPRGTPTTLFIAFALYGAALIATPRILRAEASHRGRSEGR